jgi:hypothetical protein
MVKYYRYIRRHIAAQRPNPPRNRVEHCTNNALPRPPLHPRSGLPWRTLYKVPPSAEAIHPRASATPPRKATTVATEHGATTGLWH